jgi:hypothetical protein
LLAAPTPQITALCQTLDSEDLIRKLAPENAEFARRVIQPLESALQRAPEVPDLPDTPAGKIACITWGHLHPENADISQLLEYAQDNLASVRFTAVSALQETIEKQNRQWQIPSMPAVALEVLQKLREDEGSRMINYLARDLMDSVKQLSRPKRRSRAQVIANPYVAGMPVRDASRFFGRSDVIEKIRSAFKGGLKSCMVYGARRCGKTSILLQIENGMLGQDFVPVYVDMQGFAGVTTNMFLRGLVGNAISAVTQAGFSVDISPLPAPEASNLRLAVQDALNKVLQSVNGKVLFLIDECEVLLDYIKEDPSLALQLQHLVEVEPNICFVFSASHAIETVGKSSSLPLLDTAKYLKITFLSREAALDLVIKPAQGIIQYGIGIPERIVDLTAGHPFYTQLLCQSLFDSAGAAGGTVTDNMLDNAIAAFLREPSPHVILSWNSLKHEEKVAGSTLAMLDKPANPTDIIAVLKKENYPSLPDRAEVRTALTELCDIGWVEEKAAEGTYRFTMELVRRWVAANRSISALADEQRARLQERIAPAWRQLTAEAIDVVTALLIAGTLVGILRIANWGSEDQSYIAGLIVGPMACFLLPLTLGRFTIGLRLLNLYPVRAEMSVISRLRAAAYAFLLAVRLWILVITIVFGLLLYTDAIRKNLLWVVVSFICGCLIVLANILLMNFTRTHRGLAERIAGVLVMYRK